MQIDIRKNIRDNFNNSTIKDIKDSIEDAIEEKDEITLPGLGVFFEILWEISDENLRNSILTTLEKGLKKR